METRRTRCRVSAPGPLIQRRRRGPPRHPPQNASPWHLPRYRVRPGLQCATNVPRTHVSLREGRNLLRPMARRTSALHAKYPRRLGAWRPSAQIKTLTGTVPQFESENTHEGLSSTHASRSESFRREILLLCTGQNRDSPQSIVIKYCEPNRTQNSQSHHAICDF